MKMMAILISAFFFSAHVAAIPIADLRTRLPRYTEQVVLNGKNVLEIKSFNDAYKFLVVLEIKKPNAFGFCTGSLIDQQFIITAAHCIENALTVKAYFFFYEGKHLRSHKLTAERWRPLKNWNAGYDLDQIRTRTEEMRKQIKDIGIVMIPPAPSWTDPISIVPMPTHISVAYGIGIEHDMPKPHFEGPRISGVSLQQIRKLGGSADYSAAVADIFPDLRTATCGSDSGLPVTIIAGDRLNLIGVYHGSGLAVDGPVDQSPRAQRLSELKCSDTAFFQDARVHINEIEEIKTDLLQGR